MIILSSSTLNFGSVSRGQSVTKQVTIYNDDSSSVTITNIVSNPSADYIPAPLSFIIAAYDSFQIAIEYIATIQASANSQIIVSNTAGPDVIIDVTAIVLTPIADVDTSVFDFGNVGIDDVVILTRQISNTAIDGSILTVSISSTDPNFTIDPATLLINSGESANVSIAFNPTAIVSYSSTINLVTNDITGSYSFSVIGNGVAPTYTVIPSTLNFGSVPVNDNKSLTFTITNTHISANLIISGTTIPDSEITINVSATEILPLQSKVFTVTFSPTTSRVVSDILTSNSNAGSITVNYSGTGLAVPSLKIESGPIDFDIYTLSDDVTSNLQISNVGAVDLEITGIVFPTISDTTFLTSVTFPFVIPFGEAAIIVITVNSTAEVIFSDNITINSNSFNAPHTLAISGNAQSPHIILSTQQLDFGTILIGDIKQLQLTIKNDKDVDLIVNIVNSAHFTVSENDFVVSSNSSSIVTVTFSLDVPGDVSEQLIVNSNDITNPVLLIDVTGSASIDHLFSVIPESIQANYLSKDIEESIDLTFINRGLFASVISGMTVTILPTVTTPHTVTVDGLPITLVAGGSITLSIKIKATDIGTIGGFLKFDTKVGDSLQFDTSLVVDYTGESFSPTISVSTDPIDFGNVAIGTTAYHTVTVANSGSKANLFVTLTTSNDLFHFKDTSEVTVSVSGSKLIVPDVNLILQSVTVIDSLTDIALNLGDPSNPNQFSVNTTTGQISVNSSLEGRSFRINYDYKQTSITLTVNEQSAINFDVCFSPRQISSETGIITISSNDITQPTININVLGSGVAAVTSIAQNNTLVKFESKVGQTISQTIVLKNTGTVKLFITNITISAPFSPSKTSFDIDPNETYDLIISFVATDTTLVNQTIIIHSNAPNLSIPLVGQGAMPILSVPASLNFGNVGLNFKKNLTLTISNSGKAEMNVSLSIGSGTFLVSPTVTTVMAESTYDVTVSFTPIVAQSYSGTIKILTDDPDHLEFNLSVTGVGVIKPVIQATSKIEFQQTNVREKSQMELVVTNAGSATLSVTDISVTEKNQEFKIAFATASILPNSSRSYTVTFSPTYESSAIIGKLRIISNDVDDPHHDVVLKGKSVQPLGAWQDFNLQDMLPDPILAVANGVDNIISPMKTILGLIKSVLNLVKVLLIDTSSLLKPILQAIAAAIDNYVKDMASTGLYVLPVFPRSNYFDPNTNAKQGFEKFLASVGGGSQAFKKKVIDSFDDIYDSNRPQFSTTGSVGAIIVAIDSGNIQDVVAGVLSLKKIFTSIEWKPDVHPPMSLQAVPGDKCIKLSWELPELITFNLSGLFNQYKMIDLIYGFQVYRAPGQGELAIATQSVKDTYNEGDVYDVVTNTKVGPIDVTLSDGKTVSKTIKASEFFKYLFKNFEVGWNNLDNNTARNLGFSCTDNSTSLENGKNYYYVVRTIMDKSGTPASPLSNEAVATPKAATAITSLSFLNRCTYFICKENQTSFRDVVKINLLAIKVMDLTGQSQQSTNKTESNKIASGNQQVNVFSFVLNHKGVNINSIKIRNVSAAIRYINKNGLNLATTPLNGEEQAGVDISKFYNTVNNTIVDWDDNAQNNDRDKIIFFTTLDLTKLSLPNDFTVVHDKNKSTVIITDVSRIGYTQNDEIVVEYVTVENLPICDQGFIQRHTGDGTVDDRFDAVECNNGSIVFDKIKSCDKYKNLTCIYHTGTSCSNRGFTKVNGKCKANVEFFNEQPLGAPRCQNGSMGASVSVADKPYRNDPCSFIVNDSGTGGTCTGYTSINEHVTGMYPDWYSYSVKSLVKPIEDFIEHLNKWVNSEIDAIQKGTESVTQFIDLLTKKIEALEDFIDTLQQIIDVMKEIFSTNAGFHILSIDLKTGGVDRIKQMVQTAKGGPDSGQTGFTAGIVILVGGPNISATWQFLKLLF